jgi:hypothetical protein
MKFTHFATIALILGAALCTIKPGHGLNDAVILEDDMYSHNVGWVFDLSNMSNPSSFHTNVGRMIGDGEPVQMKHYEVYGVQTLNQAIYITDSLTAFVYDQSKVVFQLLDHNGKMMYRHWFYDFNSILKDIYCTGFAFNEARNLLYVGCNEAGTSTDPGSLLIATYDISAQDVTSQEVIVQNDGFRIINRLEMFITTAPQDADEEVYLVVYDKGKSNQMKSRQDNMVRVFRNVAYRRLKFYLLAQLQFADGGIDIVYDLYPYNNNIIATARVGAHSSLITLALCTLNNAEETLRCGSSKPTTIKNGYVSMQNTGRVETLCNDGKVLTVYSTNGDFSSSSWMSTVVNQQSNILIPTTGEYARLITTTEHGAIISYETTGNTDAGALLTVWGTEYNDYFPDLTGFAWEKSLILGDIKTGHVGLYRTILSAVWVAGFELKEGANPITVTATDKDNTVTANATITVTEDIFSHVSIGDIPAANVTSGKVAHFDTDGKFSGNELTVSAVSSNTDALKVSVVQNRPVNMTWNGSPVPAGSYFFDGFMAAVEVITGTGKQIHYGKCTVKDAVINCKESGLVTTTKDALLMNRAVHLGKDNLLMYSLNKNSDNSVVYIMNVNEVHKRSFKEQIVDVNGIEGPKMNYVAVAFANRVELYSVNPNDAAEWTHMSTSDASTWGVKRFCPVSIAHPQAKHNLAFEILSTCHTPSIITSSSSVFQLAITSHTNNHEIPLSSFDTPGVACSFGIELLVASDVRVYGVAPWDDYNFWNVPLSDLHVKPKEFTLTCLDNQETAVLWGTSEHAGENGKLKKVYVVRGNSGWRQDRRYPVGFEVEADTIDNYAFAGGVISVVYNEGSASFMQTYTDPVIIAVAQSVDKETHVNVDVTAKNGIATAHTTIVVDVLPKGE